MLRTRFLHLLAAGGVIMAWTAATHAAPIQGFGELKFGMPPAEVEALDGCSSHTECLYTLLGKNRYFTLGYGPVAGAADQAPGGAPHPLSRIDIEMGAYTPEWFREVLAVLESQYAVIRQPTEDERARFQQRNADELVIGFAEGRVLLQVLRRVFGNIIVHVIYQDAGRARAQRQAWNAAPAQ